MPAEEVPATKAATDRATAQRQRFVDAMDKIRQRADTTAKAVAGLATTILTAIGFANFADLFPTIEDKGWVNWIIVISFILMAFVAGFFVQRLWRVSDPLVTKNDPDGMTLSPSEHQTVFEIYKDFATLNEVPSLRAYEARAFRLERLALGELPENSELLEARANLIEAEVLATEARAGAVVVRDRARNAILDLKSAGCALLFVVSLAVFAGAADYLDAERTDSITIAKACADARTAGATELPDICDQPTESPPETAKTAAGVRAAEGIEALATAYKNCRIAVQDGQGSLADCDPLLRALAAASS